VAIIQWFQQWRSGEVRVRRDWLDTVHRAGAVPMIVWEPWERPLNGYASPSQASASVAAIASGRYDAYIRGWARALAQYRRPVLIKFMHEMNGSWYPWSIGVNGNTAAGYVRAWRHVHDLFRAAGATNVAWVWSLNTELGFDRPPAPPASYYPGPQYVDWVGVSGMNWGTTQTWSRWLSADTIFRDDYHRLRAFGRPLMISEIGAVSRGGDQVAWVTTALERFRRAYPAVRAVVWFDAWYSPGIDFRLSDRSRRALTMTLAGPYWGRPVQCVPTALPRPQRPPSPAER
jgi:beta-mannanase